MIDLSRPDWETRIRLGQSLLPDAARDINPAEFRRAVEIFNRMRLPDVVGTPALRDAAGEWFREAIGALLGSTVDGARVIREAFVLVPKKQSKTTYSAAAMLTALLLNKRPRAEFFLIAPTQHISEMAYSQAEGMISIDPDGFLQKRFLVQSHLKTITDRVNKAKLIVKTFDTSVLTGSRAAGILLDELHEISRNSRAGVVIRQIRGGMVATPESFLIFITTQSDGVPAGAFKDELKIARDVRDGHHSAAVLPMLYEFPRDIQAPPPPGQDPKWFDPALWHMVTPNLGRSVTIERMVPDFETARKMGEASLRGWASQHLNIEMGISLGSNRWAGVEYWQRNADPAITREYLIERCDVIIPGIDGGGLDDLLGFALLGRDRETRDWLLWSHAWCHRSVLERRKSIAARLEDFQAAGELTIVDDAFGDVSDIVQIVQEVFDAGLLGCVAVDPAGIGEIVDAMASIGVTVEEKLLVGVSQGYRMMNAIKTAERRLAAGTLRHSGMGLMAWCIGNLNIEATATAIRATKMAAGDAKIDPAMAMFNAIDIMSGNPEAMGASIFSDAEIWESAA